MNGQVTVYSLTGCPHCLQAKHTLREHDLQYIEVSVDKCSIEIKEWLKEKTGKSSVPQIFFNDTLVGGNEKLQAAIKDEVLWNELCNILNEKYVSGSLLIPELSESSISDSSDQFNCEADPLAVIIDELINSGVLQAVRQNWFSLKYEHAFSGQMFIQWYCKSRDVSSEEGIIEGSKLLQKKFILPLDSKAPLDVIENDAKTFYRLNKSVDDTALNAGVTQNCEIESASELSETLRRLILQLFNDYISSDGKHVDYEEMKNSTSFAQYVKMSKELQRVSVESLPVDERKAFFINIYNVLVIHATALYGPPKGWLHRLKFFRSVKYIIGGHPYCLNDIEDGVLRGNKKGVLSLFPPFGKSDPRKVNSLPKVDPRIHFALNCGAKSCPPIKTFTAEGIDKELDLVAAAFLEDDDGVEIITDAEMTIIRLTSLIKWFSSDFGDSVTQILQWVADHLQDEEKKRKMVEAVDKKNWKISYIPYDWGTNAKE